MPDNGALPEPASSSSHSSTLTARGRWKLNWNLDDLKSYLYTDVDPERCTFQVAAYCFMTGYIDSISFTAIFIWCGFQTGNTVQLSLALARLFSPGNTDFSFRMPDRQALTSLITFLLGASLGRIGDKMGPKTRYWLFLGTFIQALMTMSAALCLWKGNQTSFAGDRGDPSWTNPLGFAGLGFASASIGLQGIMGKRVNSQFATTVVLTTIWCEFMADPKLFRLRPVKTRDHRALSVFALFLGGFVGRALIDKVGASWTFGIGAFFRLFIALSWLPAPGILSAKPSSSDSPPQLPPLQSTIAEKSEKTNNEI